MSGTNVVLYQSKKKNTTGPSFQTFNKIDTPMDFSFHSIGPLQEAINEEPRYPVSPRGKGKQIEHEPGTKCDGRCLRINNNNITSLENLTAFAEAKFVDWRNLGWIDLSQNEMTIIGPELTEFEHLQILYLHGNQISDIAQVDKLMPLSKLKKLTLHANPVENVRSYKYWVLSKLPQLLSLDFCTITKADRKTASTFDKMIFAGAKKKKKAMSDED